jgi:Leucine-rich repeat (LRR) protein
LSVDISSNNLRAEGIKAVADALRGNTTLKVLNVSTNNLIHNATATKKTDVDMSGIMTFADAIKDMGVLTSLDVSNNSIRAAGTKLLAEALTGNKVMTELIISSNNMTFDTSWGEMSGITALADAISDMRALSSLNLADNKLCGVWTDPQGRTQGTFDSAGKDSNFNETVSLPTPLGSWLCRSYHAC